MARKDPRCAAVILAVLGVACWQESSPEDRVDEPELSASRLDSQPKTPDQPGHLPFTTWDDGPDAIPFDSLSAAEKDAVMEQATRSETNAGYDVAQAWSAHSHEMADLAVVETARRLAGLTGTDDIGVAP